MEQKPKKIPIIFNDLFLAVLSSIPGVNFVATAFLIARKFKYETVTKEYFKAHNSLASLQNTITETTNESTKLIEKLEEEKRNIQAEIEELKKEYAQLSGDIIYEYVDTTDYTDVTSEEIKNELALLKLKEKEMIKNEEAYATTGYFKNEKERKARIKQISKCFVAETNEVLNKLKINNVDASRDKIVRSFEMINNIFSVDNVQIQEDYLMLKLDELTINYHILAKIEEEKIRLQEEREVLREEAKVRKEIEREKKKIEKEEQQFKNEISRLMSYLNKSESDVERELYIDKIKELEEKLALLEKDKKQVLDRETNTRAGYVYIISNVGSFGENIYKIGVTRRLEPMDRIKELSSASVPFQFDVHAMIFSEDAPGLENILHEHFRNHAINKVNPRKEFFNIDLEEAKQVVLNNHNNTVEFKMLPDANEYRQSLKIVNNTNK